MAACLLWGSLWLLAMDHTVSSGTGGFSCCPLWRRRRNRITPSDPASIPSDHDAPVTPMNFSNVFAVGQDFQKSQTDSGHTESTTDTDSNIRWFTLDSSVVSRYRQPLSEFLVLALSFHISQRLNFISFYLPLHSAGAADQLKVCWCHLGID